MGLAGQPAESDFDSGTDTDASSEYEATALDYSDMPTYASLAEIHADTSQKGKTHGTADT
eukprot:3485987-Pyramimonas_sp.AAC.1